MLKKILLSIVVLFVLLIGGIFVFLQTKSDFILEKVSSLVEESTGAPLSMEALPNLSFLPSPSVTLGKASWGTPEFLVKFESARVHFSFIELFQGNFALAKVALDGLDLTYDSVALSAKEDKNTKEVASTSEEAKSADNAETSSIASALEEAFKFIPENISLTNSTIHYKDATQNIKLTNLNTQMTDLALNQKSSMGFKSLVQYVNPAESQDIELSCDMSIRFVLAQNLLSLELDQIEIEPKKGLGFTENITLEGQTQLALEPLDVRALNATLKSPFAQTTIKQTGELNKDGLLADIAASVYPRQIVKSFAPETVLPSTKDIDTISFTTQIAYKDDTLSLQNFESSLGDASIKSSLTYDQKADAIKGELELADFVIDNFIESANTSEETSAQSASTNSNANTSTKVELPSALQKTNFDIAIKLTNMRYDTINIESLSTKLQGKNSLLGLNELKIKTLDSDISAQVTMDLGSAQLMTINANIPSLNIDTWNKALTGGSDLGGTAKVDTKLSFPIGDPISNLNGSGQIDLANLKIESSVIPTVAKILVASKVTDHYFEFADGKIPFSLAKSVLTLNKAYLNSSSYYLTASGTANLLSEALDLNVEAGKGENSTLIIPVSIKGTMSDPKVSISLKDSASIVTHIIESNVSTDLGTLNEKIDEKLTDGISSGLNKLFGK